MPLSDKALTSALCKTVRDVFHSNEKDQLSVRFIRTKVEEEHELGEGFLNQGKWKDKSKGIIKGEVDKLLQGDEEEEEKDDEELVKAKSIKKTSAKKATPAAKGKKRSSTNKQAPIPKRQKKEETPASESELSDLAESEVPEIESEGSEDATEAKPKKEVKKTTKANPNNEVSNNKDKVAAKINKKSPLQKAVVSSDSELSDIESIAQPEALAESKSFKSTSPKIRDSPLSTPLKTEEEISPKLANDEDAGNDSDSSAMSVVLDGPLSTKPRSKKSKSTSSKSTKVPKTTKPKIPKAKTTAELTPNEQLIKTLQSQLVKCGIRKIWAFELKKCETENEKIKHLKNMLTEVGMTGRFSEGRAKEIKEMRELQADLEAVKEGEKAWGLGRGSRRSGGSSKEDKKKVESSEDDTKSKSGSPNDEDDESEDDEDVAISARARRKNDLAFLGDEETSDDD
ncbi:hypothetical protein EYC80_007768 [Monilinia laxa]|uniref:Transcriptional regulator n=1 Tax=Monilinia laxa TaxID=61186 RepID=A0A5N6JWZ4_MONLA|nr:hypothetical protein EYC80_007768 [Monilinia laxa]